MSIFDRLLDPLFNRIRTKRKSARVEIAPPGYDPIRDPDGSQLANMDDQHVQQASTGTKASIFALAPWALAFSAVVAVSVWWFVLRPAAAPVVTEKRHVDAAAVTKPPTMTIPPRPTDIHTATPMPTRTLPPVVTATRRADADRELTRSVTVTKTPTITPTSTTGALVSPITPDHTPTPSRSAPVAVAATSAPVASIRLASNGARAGTSMAITGNVPAGVKDVKIMLDDDRELASVTPSPDGAFAVSFGVPGDVAAGYHVVSVVWPGGTAHTTIQITIPPTSTPTITPIPPTPTNTPTPTSTPTITPIPEPTATMTFCTSPSDCERRGLEPGTLLFFPIVFGGG